MAPQYIIRSPLPGSATLALPPDTAPSSVLPAICEALSLPAELVPSMRLSRWGRPWDGRLTEEDAGSDWVAGEAALRVRGGAPKKRCQHAKGSTTESQCSQPALRLVGDCPYCHLQFCASHRIPEDHKCSNLSICREKAYEMNKAKLESERTVANKMVGAS